MFFWLVVIWDVSLVCCDMGFLFVYSLRYSWIFSRYLDIFMLRLDVFFIFF